MKQGEKFIEKEADLYFERNHLNKHNIFSEYLVSIFPKKEFSEYDIAELGTGRNKNIEYLSHYVKSIDGYDGSQKAIDDLMELKKRNKNVDGKRVNLGDFFIGLKKYDLLIYGFFAYVISDEEFNVLIENSKRMLNQNRGYIFIYDFLTKNKIIKNDSRNSEIKIFKRNLNFYLENFEDFDMIDFRLFENSKLLKYLNNDNTMNIDVDISSDNDEHAFCALFKLKS